MTVEAPVRQAPAAETLPSHEVPLGQTFAGLQPRLLNKDQSVLNPQNNLLPDVTREQLTTHDQRDYDIFARASYADRDTFWRGIDGDFNTKRQAWIDQTAQAFTAGKAFFEGTIGTRWAALYEKLHINVHNVDAGALYDSYFTGQRKDSQVKKFVADVRDAHRSGDGRIDGKAVEENLSAIKWLANIFGRDHAAEIITQLVAADAAFETDPDKLIDKANEKEVVNNREVARVNRLEPREKELLAFLWHHREAPVQPTPQPESRPVPKPVVLSTPPAETAARPEEPTRVETPQPEPEPLPVEQPPATQTATPAEEAPAPSPSDTRTQPPLAQRVAQAEAPQAQPPTVSEEQVAYPPLRLPEAPPADEPMILEPEPEILPDSPDFMKDLIARLRIEKGNEKTYGVLPDTLKEYLKTFTYNIPVVGQAKLIDGGQTSIDSQRVLNIVGAKIDVAGNEIGFNASIVNVEGVRKIRVVNHQIDDSRVGWAAKLFMKGARGFIDGKIKNLDESLKEKLDKMIEEVGWEVSGFQIDDNALFVDFRKKAA